MKYSRKARAPARRHRKIPISASAAWMIRNTGCDTASMKLPNGMATSPGERSPRLYRPLAERQARPSTPTGCVARHLAPPLRGVRYCAGSCRSPPWGRAPTKCERGFVVHPNLVERAKLFLYRHFERIFVLLLVGAMVVIHAFVDQKFAFLSFYYLPIILAGFYGGRRFAVVSGLFVASLVFFYQAVQGLDNMLPGLYVGALLSLVPWAGFLILTGYVVGRLAEQREARLAEVKNAYLATLELLAFHIEATEKHQQGHSNRVAPLAERRLGARGARDARRRGDHRRIRALLRNRGRGLGHRGAAHPRGGEGAGRGRLVRDAPDGDPGAGSVPQVARAGGDREGGGKDVFAGRGAGVAGGGGPAGSVNAARRPQGRLALATPPATPTPNATAVATVTTGSAATGRATAAAATPARSGAAGRRTASP